MLILIRMNWRIKKKEFLQQYGKHMLHPLQKAIVQAIWWGRLLDLVLMDATDLLSFKFMSAAAKQRSMSVFKITHLFPFSKSVSALVKVSSPLRFFYTSQFIYSSSVLTHAFPARTDTQFCGTLFSLKPQHLVISQRNFFFFRGNSVVFFWERTGMKGESQKFPSH